MVARLFFLIFCLTYTLVAQDTKVNPVTAAELWESREIHRLRQIGFREITELDDVTKLPINAQTALKLLRQQQQQILQRHKQDSIPACIDFLRQRSNPQAIDQTFALSAVYRAYCIKSQSTNQIMMLQDLETLSKRFTEVPTNPIAAWLQWLFPCHMRGVVIANYSHMDPIGELVQDVSGQWINHLIQLMVTPTSKPDKKANLQQFFGNFLLATVKGKAVRRKKEDLADKGKTVQEKDFEMVFGCSLTEYNDLPPVTFSHKRITPQNRLDYLRRSLTLADILTDALEHEKTCKDYPRNIVINSFLTFLYVRWNSILPFQSIKSLPMVTRTEEIELYNQKAHHLTAYQGGIRVGKSDPFYDCGETTILNMIRLSLYSEETSEFDLEKLRTLFKLSPQKNDLAAFFTTFYSPAELHTHIAHQDWSKILSDLNKPGLPAVIYAKDDTKEKTEPGPNKKYEIYGHGIENLLNVFALLTQDPLLLMTWPDDGLQKMKQAYEKFNHLMSLLYGEQIRFQETADPDQSLCKAGIMSLYPSIRYKIHEREFILNVDPLHFDLMEDDSHKLRHTNQINQLLQIVNPYPQIIKILGSSILYWGAYIKERSYQSRFEGRFWGDSLKDSLAMTAFILSNHTYIQPWHIDLLKTLTTEQLTFKLSLFLGSTALPKLSKNKAIRIALAVPALYSGYVLVDSMIKANWIFDNSRYCHFYFFMPNAAEHLGISLVTYGFMKTTSYLGSRTLSDHLSFNTAWYATAIAPALTLAVSEALWLYQLASIINSVPKTLKILILLTCLPIIITHFNPYVLQTFGQHYLFEMPARLLCQYTSIDQYTLFHDMHCW